MSRVVCYKTKSTRLCPHTLRNSNYFRRDTLGNAGVRPRGARTHRKGTPTAYNSNKRFTTLRRDIFSKTLSWFRTRDLSRDEISVGGVRSPGHSESRWSVPESDVTVVVSGDGSLRDPTVSVLVLYRLPNSLT